jgi:hypothetical protein
VTGGCDSDTLDANASAAAAMYSKMRPRRFGEMPEFI